jgi:hypothetical protein
MRLGECFAATGLAENKVNAIRVVSDVQGTRAKDLFSGMDIGFRGD